MLEKELLKINEKISIFSMGVDLSKPENAYSRIVEMIDKVKSVDVLFNNAGIGLTGTLDLSVKDFSNMVDLNVKGVFSVAKAVGLRMRQQGYGYIINMASISGKNASPYIGCYASTKFAVVGLSQALSKELEPYHVKVTALCPGVVDTEMTKDFDFPHGKKITIEEVVNSVDYLLNLGKNAIVESLDIAASSK